MALAFATLLTPGAVTAFALGFWRIAADVGMAGQFAIRGGLFSHWQVWMAIAFMIQTMAIALNRYGNGQALRQAGNKEPRTLLDSGI